MEPTKNLLSKLVEIMAEVDHVEKRGKNTAQNYAYVKATDLARAVRAELAKRNVLMFSSVENAERYTIPTKNGSMGAIDIRVKYTFEDGDSGEKREFYGYGTGADSGDKAIYKAHTGALKYALRNTFLVPDESDPEADEKTDTETHGAQTAPKPTQTTAARKTAPSAPAKTVSGDLLNVSISKVSQKETKTGGQMWSYKTQYGWMSTFDPVIGEQVKEGDDVTFQVTKKGEYTNIVALVNDEPPAFDDGSPMITDEDIPF